MSLLSAFKDFVVQHDLLPGAAPTLLAVSGGLDSIVLAHLFRAAELPGGIAHCNFQLRGEESGGDELFVRDLADRYALPFFVHRFDTAVYAEQQGVSIQMAARALRYAWLEDLRAENDFGAIATAHHGNDALETVLLNFARGTGLAGLTGIPLRNGSVIRPLLFATRPEIEHYARENDLPWREDRSNATDDYARNFVRHNLVPPFQALNPNFLATAARNLRHLRGTRANADFLLRRHLALPDRPDQGFSIDKQALALLPDARQALQEALAPYGFTEEQARQLVDNGDHVGMALHSPAGWRILNDRRQLFVTPADSAAAAVPLRIQADDLLLRLADGRTLLLTAAEALPPYPDGRLAVLVDAGKLQFPLLLRPWQAGDWFQPFGMQGQRQKLQDFFTNAKLSRLDKEQMLVLENGDGAIIWIPGHRLDERFSIQERTSQALKISFL